MAINSITPDSPFYNSKFPKAGEDNRVVQSGANGSKVVSEGDTSRFKAGQTNQAMGKDQFLKLLVTQLQNQDPLKPSTDQEFAAQLAQFSSLESSQNIEKEMSGFAADIKSFLQGQTTGLQASASTSATGLIGKEVMVDDSEITYDGGGTVPLVFSLDRPTAIAAMVVEDKDGRQVAKTDISNSKGDEFIMGTFNGTGLDGKKLAPGTYKVRVVDSVGKDVGVAIDKGTVSSVSFKDGETVVKLGSGSGSDKPFSFSKVRQVGGLERLDKILEGLTAKT